MAHIHEICCVCCCVQLRHSRSTRFGQGGRPDALYRLEDRDAALAGEFCRAHGRGHSLYALSLSHAMQVAIVRLNTRPDFR